MKVSLTQTEQRVEIEQAWSKIQSFGKQNDYPQRIKEIVRASGTGSVCVSLRRNFIKGRGWVDQNLALRRMNLAGLTGNQLLSNIAKDWSFFDGCSLHTNWNALGQIVEINYTPIETLRFSLPCEETGENLTVWQHPDWGMRNTAVTAFDIEMAREFDLWNPNPAFLIEQFKKFGGIEKYPGQILYFGNEGLNMYPLSSIDSVTTDMNSEEGCATIKNRNCKNNFLPAGMIWLKKVQEPGTPDNTEENEEGGGKRKRNGKKDENT